MATKYFVVMSAVLAFVFGFAPPAAAQIQECICDEVGGGPPGFPPHPNMRPATTYECAANGDLVATLVFNRPVANTVATRGSFPGFSSPNAICGAHQGLRLAGESPIGASDLDANTVQLTYDGSNAVIQGLIASAPASLTVFGTYFQQPHLVDQGELLCIQRIDGVGDLERCPVAVPLDIKPQSCPNPLNCNEKGVLSVAILGTADFDVTQVDPASVQLEGVSALRSALEDVAAAFEPFTGKQDCSFDCNDFGPDGLLDLTLKFDTQDVLAAIGIDPDDDKACLVLRLTGNLQDGTPIVGEDVVRILCKKKK